MSSFVLYLKVLLHRIVDPVQANKYVENRPAPAMMKRRVAAEYAQKYHCNVFIETGTYLGEMVEYQAKNFEKVYSIEIAEALYRFSSKRLKKRKNVIIEKGDSGVVLGELVKRISSGDRILFWLDGHYSGGETGRGKTDCPIYEELSAILLERGDRDIILIDDARCFNGTGGYPRVEDLRSFITDKAASAHIEIKQDIIRVVLNSEVNGKMH